MTRALKTVAAGDPSAVLDGLAGALSGDGPAILPLAPLPLAREASTIPPVPPTVPQRVAVVIETSGSTGRPKRVALSADALLASAAASESALGGPGQWLLALPTNYIAGSNVLVRSLAAQTAPVILPAGHFDALAFCELAATMDAKLRFVSLVPAQLARLIDALDTRTALLDVARRFDRILLGGQAAPAPLIERCLELGLNVTRTYGSTETSGGCVYDGVPIGNAAVRLVDGQIELAGSMLAEGYLGDPEATALAFVDDADHRWYRTGDTGELADGVLSVSGRMDDVIVSGGVKVSLTAVEAVVRGIPGLAEAVVVSRQDERWGEVPVVVAATPGVALETVRNAVAAALGKPAAPASVLVVPRIPLLATGKADRMALRDLAVSHRSEQDPR